MTAPVDRPGFVGLLTVVVLGWVLANLGAAWLDHEPADLPLFVWLQGVVGFMAFYITVSSRTATKR